MHKLRRFVFPIVAIAMLVVSSWSAFAAEPPGPRATRLLTGMQSGSGSTVGPDGALYVVDNIAGSVLRVNPVTGKATTFASGLPRVIPAVGEGGAMDVAFIGHKAYVLVTLVSSDLGGNSIDGIYRVDGPHKFTVIADIGAWAIANPPPPITAYDTPTGVQYAMQPFRGGFLVTDGHHNRVLWVRLDGKITQLIQFNDVVSTGLAVSGNQIFVSEAGPVPHLPQNGKIVTFRAGSQISSTVAAGAPLLLDVEFGPGHNLYGVSQGHFTPGQEPGSPADPNTGSLVRARPDGSLKVVIGGLNQPTSLEFIHNTAYVVTLGGEVWKITGIEH